MQSENHNKFTNPKRTGQQTIHNQECKLMNHQYTNLNSNLRPHES